MAKSVRKYEIWMVDFLNREGALISGFRPAIIISNDLNNRNFDCQIATVIPLTTSTLKGGLETHVPIHPSIECNSLKINSIALVEQMTTVSKNHVRFCLGKISDHEIESLNNVLKEFFNFL